VWAGVDNAWEQEKLEARKMLENAAESHTSGARFVGTLLTCKTHHLKKTLPQLDKFLSRNLPQFLLILYQRFFMEMGFVAYTATILALL
jgi:hypothetical protein